MRRWCAIARARPGRRLLLDTAAMLLSQRNHSSVGERAEPASTDVDSISLPPPGSRIARLRKSIANGTVSHVSDFRPARVQLRQRPELAVRDARPGATGVLQWWPTHLPLPSDEAVLGARAQVHRIASADSRDGLPVPALTDRFGREHNYLRMSLTERCSLRCVYCMPLDGVALTPEEHLASDDELVAIAGALA